MGLESTNIKKHGVLLTALNHSHLEILREWRNSDFVRQFMFYQQEISPQEQLNWFSKLHEGKKYYFIISDDNGNYGCCNLNVSVDDEGIVCGEGGIFSASESNLNSLTPVKAIFALYEWAFEHHQVSYIKAQIRSDNKRAIRFNHGIGFSVDRIEGDVTYATLTPEAFKLRYNKVKNVLG